MSTLSTNSEPVLKPKKKKEFTYFTLLLFIVLGFGIGWLLGGPDAGTRRVMALGTGQRNIAAALVVASQSFDDPKVVVMVIVVAIVGLIILMPLSRALASRVEPTRHGG